MGAANPWRLAAAIGLIAVLAGVLVWQVFDRAPNDVSEVDTVSSSLSASVVDEDVWIAAAQDALDAWARFGSTGDLSVLRGFFDAEGPQYGRLVGEAPTIVTGGGAYEFVLVEPSAVMNGGSPVVSGEVNVLRDGELLDELKWDIHLVVGDGGWLLWTVEDAQQ